MVPLRPSSADCKLSIRGHPYSIDKKMRRTVIIYYIIHKSPKTRDWDVFEFIKFGDSFVPDTFLLVETLVVTLTTIYISHTLQLS